MLGLLSHDIAKGLRVYKLKSMHAVINKDGLVALPVWVVANI